jgi:hypothetical protein
MGQRAELVLVGLQIRIEIEARAIAKRQLDSALPDLRRNQ